MWVRYFVLRTTYQGSRQDYECWFTRTIQSSSVVLLSAAVVQYVTPGRLPRDAVLEDLLLQLSSSFVSTWKKLRIILGRSTRFQSPDNMYPGTLLLLYTCTHPCIYEHAHIINLIKHDMHRRHSHIAGSRTVRTWPTCRLLYNTHRMVMKNRPADSGQHPGESSTYYISFIRTKQRTRANDVFFYKRMKNVSCEYDRLNGWNSTLQAAWYPGTSDIYTNYRSRLFYVLSLWRI